MNKKYILQITLKSDLCAGSGYSYAGTIDTDVCYDECGFPYIPSRRIKGCLRECMKLLGYEAAAIQGAFGERGQDGIRQRAGVRIYDAYLQDHTKMHAAIAALMRAEGCKGIITQQQVLNQYTNIKAQTRLSEDGSALRNTLRYTRTVNHYDIDGKELVFEAEVCAEENYEEILRRSAKALRHIGINHNRGLGNIRCELRSRKEETGSLKLADGTEAKPEEDCILKYTIRTDAPVVISRNNDSSAATYMNGQGVLGYFANAYLRSGKSAETEEFENLFLKDRVIFGALYPSEGEKVFYPAPSFVSRLKKTKKYVNQISSYERYLEQLDRDASVSGEERKERKELYNPGNGNQPKKLNGKYVYLEADETGQLSALLKEVETEILYHHRKAGEDVSQQLYVLEAISKNQEFTGEIYGKYEDLKKLIPFVQSGVMHLGRSRNVQYGKCRVTSIALSKAGRCGKVIPKGSLVMVSLQSDAFFFDENGYTIQTKRVRDEIAKDLKLSSEKESYSEVSVAQISGYYGKWNLRRQAIPAVTAGSSFAYILSEDYTPGTNLVGVRNGEGYGKVNIMELKPENWQINELSAHASSHSAPDVLITKETAEGKLVRKIFREYLFEEMRLKAELKKVNLTNSAVGRITLMLKESINASNGNTDACRKDFTERYRSIRDKEKLDKVEKFVRDAEKAAAEFKADKEPEKNKALQDCRIALGISEEELDAMVDDLWADHLMYLLIELKYAKKGEKQS